MTAPTQPGRHSLRPGNDPAQHVTVSMPYWGTPDTVRAAVEAVLEQTHPHLTLYVVNDGDHVSPPWRALADIKDPRLIRVELEHNRGRYFCDAAILAATESLWFAIHDADDVADPDWLESLITLAVSAQLVGAFAPQRVLEPDGQLWIEPVAQPFATTARLRHLAHHAAVYNTLALRASGGPHPAYTIGYDTLMVNMLGLHGPIGVAGRPLYTRQVRPGSLTTSPVTGKGSPARRAVRRDLDALWARAQFTGPGAAFRESLRPGLSAEVFQVARVARDRPCCEMHNRHCEAPADLCCGRCTEVGHSGLFPHADATPCVMTARRLP